MSSDDWEYHHTTDSGHRVNEDGNDRYGHGHNYDVRPSGRSNSSSGGSASGGTAGITFVLVIVGLTVAGYVLSIVVAFIKENWVTIVAIFTICVVCAITCAIIRKIAKEPGLKVFFTILDSIGLICAALFFNPARIDAKVYKDQQSLLPIQEKDTIKYGKATVNIVNIRSAPSVDSDIIGSFSKNDEIEITGKLGSWWEVKFEDGGGYVDSTYVR
jgi:hypothetical protein